LANDPVFLATEPLEQITYVLNNFIIQF